MVSTTHFAIIFSRLSFMISLITENSQGTDFNLSASFIEMHKITRFTFKVLLFWHCKSATMIKFLYCMGLFRTILYMRFL